MTKASLAIAAPEFGAFSETFIRDHVRQIAPGATILITQNAFHEDELEALDVLVGVPSWEPSPNPLTRAVQKLALHYRRVLRPGLRFRDVQLAQDFIQRYRPEALLVEYLTHANLFVDLAKKIEVPLFAYAHGFDIARALNSRRERWHLGRLFHHAERIFVASNFSAERLVCLDCPQDKLRIIPLGVDTDLFQPRESRNENILMVCRLVAVKGPHLAIRAFCEAARVYSNIRLDVVGDGPLRSFCEAEAARHGFSDRVKFHGALDAKAVAALFSRAKMYVQHSVTTESHQAEAFGIALIEAMASAVPIVATRHGAIVETVSDGETGILVEEYNVSGMSKAIISLLDDPVRAEAMGAAGRARVLANFTHARSAERLRAAIGLARGGQV